ncbi:SCO family protein [Paenirhodobacter enshiensis]|uniref:Electron transporter SenC n=1 Tax=Paenirhodobacter enshiensis TaxID=1105367 RepID=A0A086XZH6_9RHOB|nr:SCO family protein [Paenirhodobacter enshiensis]KFI27426.1 electron transporter SenC [Paenirhodobacter enshiensis]
MARNKRDTSLRKVQLAALGVTIAALAAMVWVALRGPEGGPDLGQGDYALQATDGTPFTEATLHGRPSAVFFGYTHCPDVCPTTLGDVAGWQRDLDSAASQLRIFFVTVDPERDTLPMLRDYLSWTDGVIGVTGPRPEIDKAIAAFRIYARKVPGQGSDYTMDHTASVMLFDSDGRFVEKIAYQEPIETVLPKLHRLIGIEH